MDAANVGDSSFVIRHLAAILAALHADPNQFPARALRADRAFDGAGHSDATAQKRGPWSGIWRRGDGEHFWRSNHQCAGEVHRLAGGDVFPAHVRVVDLVFAQNQPGHGSAP